MSVTPIASRRQIAITFTLPPPVRNVSTVAELVAHAGHMLGMIAHAHITIPSGFHMRMKPATAVSPVASV